MSACEHTVGYVPEEMVTASSWNSRLAAFVAEVETVKVHGQSEPVPDPGTILEFHFCPDCGVKLDRVALGLLSYEEAHEIMQTNSLVSTGDTHNE